MVDEGKEINIDENETPLDEKEIDIDEEKLDFNEEEITNADIVGIFCLLSLGIIISLFISAVSYKMFSVYLQILGFLTPYTCY